MKSKMWFFNKTLFKKDITRFAPVWGIYTVVLLLTGIQSFEHFHSANFNGWDYQLMHFEEGIYNMVPLHFILALITASCLFGDLTRSRMSLSVHALPVRREQIYVTHFAAGILFSLVPNTALVLIQCCRIPDWSFLFFAWLGSSTMQYLFFFSLAAVAIPP